MKVVIGIIIILMIGKLIVKPIKKLYWKNKVVKYIKERLAQESNTPYKESDNNGE